MLNLFILPFAALTNVAMACPNLSGSYSCKKLKPVSSDQSSLLMNQTKDQLQLKSDLFADGTMAYNLNSKPSKKSFFTPFKKQITIEAKVNCDPLVLKSTETIDDQIHLTHTLREFYKEKSKLYIFSKYIVAGNLTDSTLYECTLK
jgi:hypothetical protein